MTSSFKGKKVLVPRGKKNAKSFSMIVESFGGIPIEVPLLAFRAVENKELLAPILSSIHTYDWLIFTSDVTVETFLSLLPKEKWTSIPKIAVIGEKTEEALEEQGISAQFKPESYVAESFADEFSHIVKNGEKILIPKGNLARDYIAQFFRKKGHAVDEVVIYETYFPIESKEKLVQLLRTREIDVLPFTSPSTIEHFMGTVTEYGLHENIKDCTIAVIGPISKKKCEAVGLTVDVMPEIYTSYEMIKAVVDFLKNS